MKLPLLKFTFPIIILLLALFSAPQNVHAAVTQGLLESCSPQVCGWSLHCPGIQLFGQSLSGISQKCRPEKAYSPCGTEGDCSLRSDGRTNCVTIDNISGNKTDLTAAICLDKKDFPQKDKGNEIKDQCVTTANCGPNQQCIQVTAWDQEYFGISEFVTSKRCLPTEIIPATFVFTDTTGSCGQNQQCSADETCVENTYVDIIAKAAYVPLPGFLTFKQPVCYKSSYLSGTCTTYGATCQVPGTGTGLCMHTLDAGADILKCVDVTYLPGGPAAPSNYACTSDTSCNKTDYKYCLTNPVTNKKQCFSQQNIFTDMSKLPDQKCSGKDCACTLVGKQGCEPTGKESICAAYGDKSTAVCINFAGSGAALADGKGTATTKPSQLPDQSVAQQTYTAFAPKLQIDIPNLTFADKITAEDGPGGIKRFSVPYLATYINAVYKYALGLGVLIGIVVLLYAGFRWMTSFGNTKAISEAKTMVGNSAFGLFLLFSAFTILYYINPELPKMKALQILAPKQDVFQMEPQDEDPTYNAGTQTPGNPGEYKVSSGFKITNPPGVSNAVITPLISNLPANIKKCSPEAAQYAAAALAEVPVCIQPLSCAFSASQFLNYIGCTDMQSVSAPHLSAIIDASGWTAIKITPQNVKNLPLGLLLGPGHVGVSIGNGKQWQSNGSWSGTSRVSQINKKFGGDCYEKGGGSNKGSDACDFCAKVPSRNPKNAGGGAIQGWWSDNIWPSWWKFVIVPPGQAPAAPKKECFFESIGGMSKLKFTITAELCDYLNSDYKAKLDAASKAAGGH